VQLLLLPVVVLVVDVLSVEVGAEAVVEGAEDPAAISALLGFNPG
jgi:hypothetical protein